MNAFPCFTRKQFQVRHSITCKKSEQYHFQTLRTFVSDIKVTWKTFTMIISEFKQFWTLWIAFPEISFNVFLKNLQKSEKCYFETLRIFIFDIKVASKPLSKKLYLSFPGNGFNFITEKKILKNEYFHFKVLKAFVFDLENIL